MAGEHECRTAREAAGYPGFRVCRHGVVWGKFGRVLKCPARDGYRGFTVYYQGERYRRVMVHQVVCATFHGERPSDDHHAAHRNGNSMDNRASNLYWATRVQNEADKLRHGRRAQCERHGMHILTDEDVRYIRSVHVKGKRGSTAALAARFGVNPQTITNAANGHTWRGLDV